MLWLIWQMGLFLIIAFGAGVALGWRLWSESGDAGRELRKAQDEIERLRRENDNLSSAAARADAVRDLPAPKPEAEPVKSGATNLPKEPDDLSQIKGLGPKAVAALTEAGIHHFNQIASWTESDVEAWNAKLNARGRIVRDDWVGQAKKLAQ